MNSELRTRNPKLLPERRIALPTLLPAAQSATPENRRSDLGERRSRLVHATDRLICIPVARLCGFGLCPVGIQFSRLNRLALAGRCRLVFVLVALPPPPVTFRTTRCN